MFVNAPFSRTPYLGRAIENGARLAAREVNANGIRVGGRTYNLKIETIDSGLSPARAVSNVRRAVGRHAVAIVDEGTGIDASWRSPAKSGVPIGVVFEGGNQVIDPVARPNVFRVAPTDHGIAFRLAEYLIPKGLHIALIHDDSEYGAAGEDALRSAFSRNESSIAGDYSVPADALDVAPQVLRARRAQRDGPARLGPARNDRGDDHRRPAQRAGTSRSTHRRPAPTRSSASSSRTIPPGSTA